MNLDRRAFHRARIGGLAPPALGPAQRPAAESPHRSLYMLRAGDREALVLAGARKEGVVAIYTSLNTLDSVPLTGAFEKKYGVKTQL